MASLTVGGGVGSFAMREAAKEERLGSGVWEMLCQARVVMVPALGTEMGGRAGRPDWTERRAKAEAGGSGSEVEIPTAR